MIIAVIAPSGAGKTWVETLLVERFNLRRLVSTTSRIPRAGENKNAYNFISLDAFIKGIEDRIFAEHVVVYGEYYGLTHDEITKGDGVVVVEVEGLKQLKRIYDSSQVYSIFLDVPEDVRKERLKDDAKRFKRIEGDREMFNYEKLAPLIDMKLESHGDWDVGGFIRHIETLLKGAA